MKVIRHKVEAKNPALRKRRAPNRAWGASGAPGYLLLCPLADIRGGRAGVAGMRFSPPTLRAPDRRCPIRWRSKAATHPGAGTEGYTLFVASSIKDAARGRS